MVYMLDVSHQVYTMYANTAKYTSLGIDGGVSGERRN